MLTFQVKDFAVSLVTMGSRTIRGCHGLRGPCLHRDPPTPTSGLQLLLLWGDATLSPPRTSSDCSLLPSCHHLNSGQVAQVCCLRGKTKNTKTQIPISLPLGPSPDNSLEPLPLLPREAHCGSCGNTTIPGPCLLRPVLWGPTAGPASWSGGQPRVRTEPHGNPGSLADGTL